MSKRTIGAGVVATVALGLIIGRAVATRGRDEAGGTVVARASRRDIAATVKATGVVKPMVGAVVRVGSRASGVVRRLHVKVGDAVESGQLLAELDARDLAARREQTAAAFASARASLAYARADLERKRRLAEERLLAPSDLDLAVRAFAVAETGTAEAAASLAYAETQLGYARIHAPIPGVVASVSTQEGETVAASLAAPTFVTLIDLSRLEVWAYVDETDIGRLHAGQEVTFTVDTYGTRELAGTVATIYPQAEIRDNVVNYVAVVRFDPPADATLRPEMTAAVRIALETRKGVVAVPRAALRRDGGRPFVRLPGTAERRFLTPGRCDEGWCEVLDGLREGEEVVVGEKKSVEGEP